MRGEISLHCLLENPDLLFGALPLYDTDSHPVKLRRVRDKDKQIVVAVEGISDRNGAESLRNQLIYTDALELPPLEAEQFYAHSLIGLQVLLAKDLSVFGVIAGVDNFGAGDLLRVRLHDENPATQNEEWFPFTDDVFPTITPEEGRVLIVPPEVAE